MRPYAPPSGGRGVLTVLPARTSAAATFSAEDQECVIPSPDQPRPTATFTSAAAIASCMRWPPARKQRCNEIEGSIADFDVALVAHVADTEQHWSRWQLDSSLRRVLIGDRSGTAAAACHSSTVGQTGRLV